MKKITLLAAVIIAASFASCKKDYTCVCTTDLSAYGGGSATTNTTIKNTKSKAKTSCTALNTTGTTCAIQ